MRRFPPTQVLPFSVLLYLVLIFGIQFIWCRELAESGQLITLDTVTNNEIYTNVSSSRHHHHHRHLNPSDNFWENKMRRTKSAVRWPAIKLFNYTGQSVVVKHIDIVYDIVSNQHHSNIALFLQFLRHNKLTSSSASTHTTTGDSAYPPPTPTPYTFTYLFLVPPNVNSQVLGMVDSFCTEINLGDDMDQNKGSSGGKKGRCTRHMKSTALLWEEAFGHFNAMPKKVDAVFMSRSSLVGPVLPHYAPEDFDVFKTFTQYLSPALPHTPVPGAQTQIPTPPPTSNPIVLSSVSVHFRNKRKKAYVSIETKDFPVMLSGEFARLLGKQERILFGFSSGASTTTDATSTGASTSSSPNAESTPVGGGTKLTGARSWLMPTLGGGLGIHVLDPHYAHIDWLRYYDLCYLKHTISLTACSKVEQTIPVDYAYIQAVGLNQTGIKSMFVKGINAMDMSIRTPLYGAYTSLFIDTTKLKSYEEYAYFVHVMNRQYNLTRDGSDHKGLDKKGGWTGYLSSLLTGGKGKSGHERSKKDLLTGDVTNSTMKNVANMHSKKTLVVYVYFEANQEAIDNFVFFAQNGGIMPSNLVDYVIVVQGKHTVAMPTQFNVRVIYKENTCFDIGSWGAVIREIYADNMQRKAQWDEAISTNNIQVIQRMQAAYKHYVDYIYKYKYYIVMNTSVRGPYLPPSWNFGSHLWTEAFTKHISDEGLGEQRASSTGFASKLFGLASITSSSASSSIESDPKHRVKLVGLSINCPDGVGRKYPHIMSMLLAFDNVVVDIWMNTKPNFDTVKLFTVATTKEGNPNAAFDPLAAVLTPTEDTILIDRPRNKKASQAQESLVFDDVLFCANQKEHSLAQESELSMSVFNAGYNIKSLQYYYRDMNWLGMYKQIVEDKKVETSHGHMISCSNILLDIFYKKAWNYKQTTPHPYDFVFVKTNRGIYKDDLFKMNYLAVDYRQFTVPHIPDLYLSSPSSTTPTHDITNTAATVNITTVSFNVDTINPTYTHLLPTDMEYYPNTGYQKVVVMFSHNFNFEGAPMWLLRIATILKKWGYRIYMYSLADGPLAKVLQKEGIQVIRFSKPAPFVKHESYKDFIGWFYQFNRHINIYYGIKPTMYLFNTVLFTKFVATLPIFQSIYVRYMWAIHEAELYDAVKSPNNYAYEHEFKELRTLNSVYLAPHKILFVSDSGREYASKFDYGQFITIRGFVKDSKCYLDSKGKPVDSRSDLLRLRTESRKILNIPEDAYVISNIGTICRRKQQHWLVDLLHQTHLSRIHTRPLYILLVGYDDKSMYEREVRKYITRANLTQQIFLIKHNSYPLHYAAAADVHTSISTHESFPLNTLEVMCLGVPIMATPAFGIREQILFPGSTGVLLPGVRNYNGFQYHVKEFFGWQLTRRRCAPIVDTNSTTSPTSRKLQGNEGEVGSNGTVVLTTNSNSIISHKQVASNNIISTAPPPCLPVPLTPEEDSSIRKKWLHMSIQAQQTVQKYFVQSAIEPYYENLMQSLAPSHRSSVNKVCVVMRFHGGQIKSPGVGGEEYNINKYFNIEESIRSIYFQQHTNWELILVPSDLSDVRAIYSLLVRYNHYFFEEVVDPTGSAGDGNGTEKRYARSNNFNKIRMVTYHTLLEKYEKKNYGRFHQNLYNLTDRAIQQCSADSNWLLVTNGDNLYHEEFFNYLDPMYDIIAYDFYSRWYRHLQSALPPCERLVITPEDARKSAKIFRSIRAKQQEGKNLDALYQVDKEAYYKHNKTLSEQSMEVAGMLSLMHNELRRNHTDLGANVVNLRRWLHEGHAYAHILSSDSSQDGTMMEILAEKRWNAKHITPGHSRFKKALYSHNPNYMSCITRRPNMYWDDSTHLCYSQKDLDKLRITYKESSLYRCITTR